MVVTFEKEVVCVDEFITSDLEISDIRKLTFILKCERVYGIKTIDHLRNPVVEEELIGVYWNRFALDLIRNRYDIL